jgi:hypothetical protein
MLHVECRYLTTVLLAYDRNSGRQLIVSHGDQEEYLGKSAKYKHA